MISLRSHRLLLAALICSTATAACAPARVPQGMLTPARQRTTNENAAADRRTVDALAERLRAARAPGAGAGAERAHAAAAAAEWLAFARDAYDVHRRGTAVDEAFAAAAALVDAVEQASDAGAHAQLARLDRLASERLRPDLWSIATALHADTLAWPVAAPLVGEAEVALVRASHAAKPLSGSGPVRQPCEVDALVDRAIRLLTSALDHARAVKPVAPPEPPKTVALAPVTAPVVTTFAQPIAALDGAVHFALNSSALSEASRLRLDSVVVSLAQRGTLRLVIEGYTDPRGSRALNARLSQRRAESVARYLSGAGLDLSSAQLRAMGPATTSRNPSREELAKARRVDLRFFAEDGTEIEAGRGTTDLQLETESRRVARPAARPARPAVRPARPGARTSPARPAATRGARPARPATRTTAPAAPRPTRGGR